MTATREIATCTLKRQHTAVVRAAMPAADLPGWLPGVFHAVTDYLERADAVVAGPAFACIELRPDDLRAAAGFPVAEPITGDGWVRPSTLPAGPAAVATHLGSCDAVESACAELDAWLAGQGLVPDGVRWEVYLTDPAAEPDPAQWLTHLVVPYRPAAM
ncbi:MAG TPA: GyrI-like domain-containing protein [Micromonosporaceae bacterium]|jgi:effector-binding domain-containing protein